MWYKTKIKTEHEHEENVAHIVEPRRTEREREREKQVEHGAVVTLSRWYAQPFGVAGWLDACFAIAVAAAAVESPPTLLQQLLAMRKWTKNKAKKNWER